MTPFDFESELHKRVLTMRILLLALIAGAVGFACIAVSFRIFGDLQAPPPNMTRVLTLVGLGFTACNALAYAIVPGRIIQSARRRFALPLAATGNAKPNPQDELMKLCDLYQTQLIVSAALLEGTAFLWLTFFIMTGQWFMLGIFLAAALLIAIKFPSAESLSRWLALQQELIEGERANV